MQLQTAAEKADEQEESIVAHSQSEKSGDPVGAVDKLLRRVKSSKPESVSSFPLKERPSAAQPSLMLANEDEQVSPALPAPSLTWQKKIHEFYVAPITTFWAFALSYAAFIVVFTYIILIKTPPLPLNGAEWFVVAYVLNLGLEQIRKLLTSEPKSFVQKVRVYAQVYWNLVTSSGVLVFFIGFGLRCFPETRSVGRVVYCCNALWWYLKILQIIQVHQKLGPYITMVGKMVVNMVYLLVLLLITLSAFGVVRQSITYPEQDWSWILVRNIFYKPFFIFFGEVQDEEIFSCADNDEQEESIVAHSQSEKSGDPVGAVDKLLRRVKSSKPESVSSFPLKERPSAAQPSLMLANEDEQVSPALPAPSLTWQKKIHEFYVAPITTFWAFALSYAAFIVVFTYIILIKTPPLPLNGAEWFVVAYVLNLGLEQIRKLLTSEPKSFVQKVRVYAQVYWNLVTSSGVLVFFIGFGLRCFPETRSVGRVVYCCNALWWYLKILQIIQVHQKLGPYITMVGKMVVNMVYLLVLLLITLSAFGVVRQSITYPEQDWSWILVRNIFYKPFFIFFGEVQDEEIFSCADNGKNCVQGHWIVPIVMTAFLIISNVLLINILIAELNDVYVETQNQSQQIWRFGRYQQVMEYESSPFLPPPLTILWHFYLIFKYCRRVKKINYALKLILPDDQVYRLHDFEADTLEDMSRTVDDGIKRTTERSNFLLQQQELIENQLLTQTQHSRLDSGRKAAGGDLVLPESEPEISMAFGDISVPLDKIKPGTRSPMVILDRKQLKIVLHFTAYKPQDDVIVLAASITSTNTQQLTGIEFDVKLTQKGASLKMDKPTSDTLPEYNSIFPQQAITQILLLTTSDDCGVKLDFDYTLRYCQWDDEISTNSVSGSFEIPLM